MNPQVTVIYEDEWLVVLAKAIGVPSQDDPSGDRSALALGSTLVGGELRPVHRIDRPASGLLVAARTADAAGRLSAAFASAAVSRRYWAIVEGRHDELDTGVWSRVEGRLVHDRRRNLARHDEQGKYAVLDFAARARGERFVLLEVALSTGRHHQIRAQLARAVAPIRGDLKYGARRSLPGGGIALHAVGLRFEHPFTAQVVRFVAEPPDDRLWHDLAGGLDVAFDGPSSSRDPQAR